ncbi:MAG: GNAT family N-acetyltransferase [Flavobacteriales bacterium]|nr:GNAT family N-acetyltransferase [Flavobacteriales bacterium]
MIEFELNPNLDLINWNRISEIFKLVNWGVKEPKDVENSFTTSSITCFMKKENEIIGFGRTVDDGKYYALLVDIVIHPNYRAQGIGKSIVNKIRNKLNGYHFITLTAAPNKNQFYQKLGWKNQLSSSLKIKTSKTTL